MGLRINAEVDSAIRAHGAETYPDECCGALIGRDGIVTDTLALPNTTEDGPRRRFKVRPQDYRAAEGRAGQLGAELLGFYHSHPDHPAAPSSFDAEHAWPWYSYLIVRVDRGRAVEATSWQLAGDRSAMLPEFLDVFHEV